MNINNIGPKSGRAFALLCVLALSLVQIDWVCTKCNHLMVTLSLIPVSLDIPCGLQKHFSLLHTANHATHL